VTYREFEDPEELRGDLQQFFRRIAEAMVSVPTSLAARRNGRTESERSIGSPVRLGGPLGQPCDKRSALHHQRPVVIALEYDPKIS
jgi:hypothetical protein